MKTFKQFLENVDLLSVKVLESLKPQIANIAQSVYDDWGQDCDGNWWCRIQEGDGGICHLIAEDIASFLYDKNFESGTISSNQDVHVYVITKTKEGVATVDIDPYVYETGYGYSWKKKPNVTITANDVRIDIIDNDVNNFDSYIDNF